MILSLIQKQVFKLPIVRIVVANHRSSSQCIHTILSTLFFHMSSVFREVLDMLMKRKSINTEFCIYGESGIKVIV